MKIRCGLGVVLGITLASSAAQAASPPDTLAVAESAAKSGEATPEGRKFGETVGQAFGREHGATIQKCAKETKRPDLTNFNLFLRIDGTGIVDQVGIKPTTNLATCMQGKLPGWKTTPPPKAGFWVKVSVNLKPK